MASTGPGPGRQNLKLCPGESWDFQTPDGLAGTRFWPKMRCDQEGNFCEIGESGGPGQTCNASVGCAPPIDTKFEASFNASGVDWVDVSLVDGWTLPFNFSMSESCQAGDGNRTVFQSIDCTGLSLDVCPESEEMGDDNSPNVSLRAINPSTGRIVGCYAPCGKLTFSNWGNKEAKYGPADKEAQPYCCPTPPVSPQQCRDGPIKDTEFVQAVHDGCPGVYGYSYDDGMGLLLCPSTTLYTMAFFCPSGPSPAPSAGETPTCASELLHPRTTTSTATTTTPTSTTSTLSTTSTTSATTSTTSSTTSSTSTSTSAGSTSTSVTSESSSRPRTTRSTSRWRAPDCSKERQQTSHYDAAWCCEHKGVLCGVLFPTTTHAVTSRPAGELEWWAADAATSTTTATTTVSTFYWHGIRIRIMHRLLGPVAPPDPDVAFECPTAAPPGPLALPVQDPMDSWTPQRREWCCSQARIGCEVPPWLGSALPAADAVRWMAQASSAVSLHLAWMPMGAALAVAGLATAGSAAALLALAAWRRGRQNAARGPVRVGEGAAGPEEVRGLVRERDPERSPAGGAGSGRGSEREPLWLAGR